MFWDMQIWGPVPSLAMQQLWIKTVTKPWRAPYVKQCQDQLQSLMDFFFLFASVLNPASALSPNRGVFFEEDHYMFSII